MLSFFCTWLHKIKSFCIFTNKKLSYEERKTADIDFE